MDTLLDTVLDCHDIPHDLEALLRERHQAHEGEYKTNVTTAGIPINACMGANSIQDIREELVDAVFNSLVAVFKVYDGSGSGTAQEQTAANLWLTQMGDTWVKFQQFAQKVQV